MLKDEQIIEIANPLLVVVGEYETFYGQASLQYAILEDDIIDFARAIEKAIKESDDNGQLSRC